MKHVLTIAGSDSCGGAGMQADLRTYAAHGLYGMSVITAVTAQNTRGVLGIQNISPNMIAQQLEAVFTDIPVHSVKIGMISNVDTIQVIAAALERFQPQHVVLDPVMGSTSGTPLLDPDAVALLIRRLVPLCSVVTPNIPEAELITGMRIRNLSDMEKAARRIHQRGQAAVLVKGGHLASGATDILFDGTRHTRFPGPRIMTRNTHGTGCTLSSAIAANLAKNASIQNAVAQAKKYVTHCIETALDIGHGAGPLNQLSKLYEMAGGELPGIDFETL